MSISATRSTPSRAATTGNSRNGSRSKTVITQVGPVEIEVPRDREATFDPLTVRKGQRRLDGVDSTVISLTRQRVDDRWQVSRPIAAFGKHFKGGPVVRLARDATALDAPGCRARAVLGYRRLAE